MTVTKKLLVGTALLTALGGSFFACGSSTDDATNGGIGAGAYGGSSGGGGTGGMLNPDSGTGGAFFDGSLGDTASEGLDPDSACTATNLSATLLAANILFLIDRTGSMNCNAPPIQTTAECAANPKKKDAAQPSKWEITRDALSTALQGLEATKPTPSVGIMYFSADGYCGLPDPANPNVEVGPLSGDPNSDPQLNALILSLANVSPKGDTPIIGSTNASYVYLRDNAANFDGNRFVVLLTDGAETCDLQQTSKDYILGKAAEVAQKLNIRTFVLGAPGSEDGRAFLSQIAFEGDTASSPTCDHNGAPPSAGDCHMDMTLPGMNFADELQKNLKAIGGVALSCEFDVPQPGAGQTVDYGKVNVKYKSGGGADEYILQDSATACSDPANEGWQYEANNTKIVLCGAACEKVKNDPEASISIELGCKTQTVPK